MALALVSLFSSADATPFNLKTSAAATCSTSITSCSTAASSGNACCVNTPGGLFVQTQFWDTDPVTGPANSWTIHGLWPDNCDGTYSESCDSSRDYTDITTLLDDNGKSSLVTYMQEFMQSNDESDEDFWEHEWAEHGTCVSTLDPSCFTDYTTGQEVAVFFQVLVDLFKTLDTYTALESAGIVPSSSATYSTASIISALTKVTGFAPIILCDSGEISEVYYGFHVTGPLANGDFVATTVTGSSSTCSGNVKYLPKTGATTTISTGAGSGPTSSSTTTTKPGKTTTTTTTTTTKPGKTTTTTTSPGSGPTGTISGEGYLNAYTSGSQDGCLISYGTWYTTGTCATYTATASGNGFTLSSSKGDCGVSGGTLSCGSGVSASTFTASGSTLAYNGQTTFYCDELPTGSDQGTISTTSEKYSVTFEWESV